MTDIEMRLKNVETRFAISELRAMYCWYTVRGRRDEVLNLFVEDGVFENSRHSEGAPVIVSGRPALYEYFARMKPARRVPLVMNEVTRIDGDFAEGTCAMLSVGDDEFAGHYIDQFKCVDGVWKFSRRQFFSYWPIYRPNTDRIHP